MEKENLAIALKDAGHAHHEYEQTILSGVRDEKWADWYAAFLVGRFSELGTASAITRLLEQAAQEHEQHNEQPWNVFYAEFIMNAL